MRLWRMIAIVAVDVIELVDAEAAAEQRATG
jgi:hypothetical protein